MGGIISSLAGITNQSLNLAKQIIMDKNKKLAEDKANELKNYLSRTVPYNYSRADRKKNVPEGMPYSDSWMLDKLKNNEIPAGYTYSDLIADGYGIELNERNKRVLQERLDNITMLVNQLKEIKEKSDFNGYPNVVNMIDDLINFKVNSNTIDEFIEKVDALQKMVGIEINNDQFQEQLDNNESDRRAMMDNAATGLLDAEDNAIRNYLRRIEKKN